MGFLVKRYVFSVFFGLVFSSRILGQSPFSADVDSLILRGIDQTFACEFDSALATFQEVTDRYPDHIVGTFYQAATLQSKMMDYETDRWERDFFRLVEKAIRMGKRQIEKGEEDPWTYFYLGSIFSYKGLYQAKVGDLISGFLSARKGLECLKRALEMNSTLYDACLGLGSYKYWAGRFYKYLRWLPWIRDEREEGVRLVRLSVDRGTFSYWVGVNSLGWIEYDRKRYRMALTLFLKGLERYPGSRFFIWGMADSYFKLGNYMRAVEIYQELLTSILSADLNNGYNEAECRLKLVMSYFELGQYEEAFHQCNAILERRVEKKIAKRLKNHYEQAEEYRKRCLEALGRRKVIRE